MCRRQSRQLLGKLRADNQSRVALSWKTEPSRFTSKLLQPADDINALNSSVIDYFLVGLTINQDITLLSCSMCDWCWLRMWMWASCFDFEWDEWRRRNNWVHIQWVTEWLPPSLPPSPILSHENLREGKKKLPRINNGLLMKQHKCLTTDQVHPLTRHDGADWI